MTPFSALICDTERRFLDEAAHLLQERGWTVHATGDDAEAAFRLLMWNFPEELPQIAILSFADDSELLEFCQLLDEEAMLARMPVIVLVDDFEGAAGHQLKAWEAIPVPKKSAPVAAMLSAVERLTSSGAEPGGPTLRVDSTGAMHHQHTEKPIGQASYRMEGLERSAGGTPVRR